MKIVEDIVCYEPNDLNEQFQHIVAEAKSLWAQRIIEYSKVRGQDQFFAASGSGIEINYLSPHHKKPQSKTIIDPFYLVPTITTTNNVLVWQGSALEVVAFLRSKGIQCVYSYGWDD